ncbi:MAG TPA: PA domain-containing protein, partial [Pyrinomonadaceae bacterium]|nr:PA domain-containing protein [Pyrinomonadaceae bacterium]
MKRNFISKLIVFAFAFAVAVAASVQARAAATIFIHNTDPAGSGFNDPTPAAPVGGNTGTTVGQQRLNAFQFAANLWGATLRSDVPIVIRASWVALPCDANGGTLAQAGSVGMFRNFPNAPFGNTWYSTALANALSGIDVNGGTAEISTQFNSNINGSANCLGGTRFYLGLDNNHGADIDLVAVLMHEFAHGLGFQTFTNGSTGAQASAQGNAFPSAYDHFLLDNSTGKTWIQMTNGERAASAVSNGNLVWNGPNVTGAARGVLGAARVRVNAPAGIAGSYAVNTAEFGPPLSVAGTTANVVQALDPSNASGALTTDGCSALTNPSAVAGRLALIDRGNCDFVVKVKNAQNAGAIGVIIANSSGGVFGGMGGSDPTINIPSVMVTFENGNTIKGQLTAGVNATLLVDGSSASGVDAQGHPQVFTPTTFSGGSSVSHWDTLLFPNQLMEPDNAGDIIHSVAVPADLTGLQLRDVGWGFNPVGDANFFVRQHYLDFLNREPDAPGLAFWRDDVLACGTDKTCVEVKRINVSAAFFLSLEFQGTGNLVYKMHKAAFGNLAGRPVAVRRADFLADTRAIASTPAQVIVGQTGWEAQLEANKQAFALAFVQRAPFQAAHGGQDAGAYVDSLFANAGVQPSAAERNAAVSAFGGGGAAGQAAALRSVAESDSVTSKTRNESFVLMQYFGYLQRDPDSGPDTDFTGYNHWLGKLNDFNGDYIAAEMVKAFIGSFEYMDRFGSRL